VPGSLDPECMVDILLDYYTGDLHQMTLHCNPVPCCYRDYHEKISPLLDYHCCSWNSVKIYNNKGRLPLQNKYFCKMYFSITINPKFLYYFWRLVGKYVHIYLFKLQKNIVMLSFITVRLLRTIS
jgi:hypothetical protein